MIFPLVVMLVCVVLAGCYTLQPAGTMVPEVGTRVALDVNDVGRVALGGTMGPEIDQVEGRLLSNDNSEYLIAVDAVRTLRGGEQRWAGEKIQIKNEYVTSVQQRVFSPGRTIAISAVGVGILAWFVGRSLLPGGAVDQPVIPPDSNASRRVPIRPGVRRKLVPLRPTPLFLPHLSRP